MRRPSGADLTTQEGVQALASAAMENFGSLDLLVLNASGGMETGMEEGYALKLNRDAQVNMLNAAVAAHARRLPRGLRDQPPGPLHQHGSHHAGLRARGPQQACRRGRTARTRPGLGGEGHLARGRLRRHDRGHRHGHPAGPVQPGRHRGPPCRGRASCTRSRSSPPRSPRWPPPTSSPATPNTSAAPTTSTRRSNDRRSSPDAVTRHSRKARRGNVLALTVPRRASRR